MKILSVFWHSVEPDSISPECFDGTNPTQSVFRDQIKFIIRNYTPISIEEFAAIVEDKTLVRVYNKPPVLLGFDDGFRDVIKCALPVLKDLNVPALLFVIGEILKDPEFVPWYVQVKHMVRRTKQKILSFNGSVFNLEKKENASFFSCNINSSYKALTSRQQREVFLDTLAGSMEVARPRSFDLDEDQRFVTKGDLSEMSASSLLRVSSHAMTHECLAQLSRDEQQVELEQSHKLLKQCCPSYFPTIAYPDGSFNKNTIEIAKRIYKFGFAVLLGASYRNQYAYPRICLQNYEVKVLSRVINPIRINIVLPVKKMLHNICLRKIVY